MKRGFSSIGLLGIGAVVVIGVLWFSVGGTGLGQSSGIMKGDLYKVQRGNFSISIQTSGELDAKNQVNIYNQLESNAVVIELVDEGSFVSEGDVLLRLNDDVIKNELRDAEMSVTDAKNTLETSNSNLIISEKRRDSELSIKQLAIDLADLALQAWIEGEVVARRQQLALAKQTAEKDYQRLFKKYDSSVRLYDQKFLSKDELDRDEIALLNADATLKKAKLDVEVYENYTYKQDKQKKESDLQQAKDELDRAIDRLASEIKSLKATIEARANLLNSREEKLEIRKRQLEMCIFQSPASGMVVYASSLGNRRDEGNPLKVGKSLWRNELVMTIPDTSEMVARVKVNEALSGLVLNGQTASLTCDAFPDEVFECEVLSVGVLAMGGGWRDPNRRDYTVEIKIDNPSQIPLKPSMRCSAKIFVDHVEDVLYVPIHAIHRDGGTVWVWVEDSYGFSQRIVVPGQFSDSYVAINEGLQESDVVLLREPTPGQIVDTLSDEGSL